MKRTKTTFVTIFMMLITLGAWADEGGFRYKHIDIKATIGADNSWDVTETFTLDFSEPRHGYYRYIPEVFYLRRDVEGMSEAPRLKFYSDVDVIDVQGAPYEVSSEDDNTVIKIGDAAETVTGEKTYVIHYRYSYPNDRCKDYDEIFHTFFGTNLEEPIDSLSFTIKSEKPFPADFAEKLKVYSGGFQSRDNDADVKIKYAANTITGWATDIEPNTAVSIYAQLPEGFFNAPAEVSSTKCDVFYYISIILIVIIIFIELTKRHTKVIRDVQYFPPKDISSAEVGTIIDTTVDNVDIASLIPWLASKGYITLKDLNAESKKDPNIEVRKKKSLPADAPEYLKKFYNLLFSGGKDAVVLKNLGKHPEKIEEIKKAINDIYQTGEKELVTTDLWGSLSLFLLAITAPLALIFSSNETSFDVDMIFLVAPMFVLPYFIAWFWGYHFATNMMTKKWVFWVSLVIQFAILFIDLAFYCAGANGYGYFLDDGKIWMLFGGSFIATAFCGKLTQNTPYRVEIMGQLLGLKEFIELAEKPRLEEILEAEPQYFYQILPYAMVFNLADKWADKFKDITMEEPEWYSGHSFATGYLLASTISHNVLSSTESAIASASVSASSGGSSGGFAGGGGGGGGGGSW